MKNRTHIITLAAIALTGATLTLPAQAQGVVGGATTGINGAGVPNVALPTDTVRQGAAGINSAQAEATRTSGDAQRDAQARAENEVAREGLPSAAISGSANATTAGQGVSAGVNADSQRAANTNDQRLDSATGGVERAQERASDRASNALDRANDRTARTEEQVTQQLNREQANAAASCNVTTR